MARFAYTDSSAKNEKGGDAATINLDLVKFMYKEGTGLVEKLSIVFHFGEKESAIWFFGDEVIRDAVWQELINS